MAASDSKDVRAEFRLTADEYRGKTAVLKWLGVIPVGFWVLIVIGGKTRADLSGIGFVGFVACIIASIAASYWWVPKLICPSCKGDMDKRNGNLGDFCPECGAQGSVEKRWISTKCTACGESLNRGRGGRRYKIHFCTDCGAHVDDEGL